MVGKNLQSMGKTMVAFLEGVPGKRPAWHRSKVGRVQWRRHSSLTVQQQQFSCIFVIEMIVSISLVHGVALLQIVVEPHLPVWSVVAEQGI